MNSKRAVVVGIVAAMGSSLYSKRRDDKKSFCSAKSPDNSAFVFIKPHANTTASQNFVKKGLLAKGISIAKEGEITAETIDKEMLIDQHYYAIASKATLVTPDQMPVSPEKFKAAFGVPWEEVLKSGNAYNALDACKFLGCTFIIF